MSKINYKIKKTNASVKLTTEFIDAIIYTSDGVDNFVRVLFSNPKLKNKELNDYPSTRVSDFSCDLPYYETENGKCYYNQGRIVSEEVGIDGVVWVTFACGEKVKCKR